jgi:pyochelin biosynthesis protein PchC
VTAGTRAGRNTTVDEADRVYQTTESWLRCFPVPGRPVPDSVAAMAVEDRLRLVCFPHAGGTAGFFRSWAHGLPAGVQLLAVQYPGRQDRLCEPCAADIHELADDIAHALVPRQPLALFGHSMGAAIAYEVATRIEGRADGVVTALIVSAKQAPTRPRQSAKHMLGDKELWAEVCELGGVPDELAGSRVFRDMVLPSLRADYRIDEAYRPRACPKLRCPVLAIAGSSDPEATADEMALWQEVAGGDFVLRVFPGGHFSMMSRPRPFLAELIGQISRFHAVPGYSADPE